MPFCMKIHAGRLQVFACSLSGSIKVWRRIRRSWPVVFLDEVFDQIKERLDVFAAIPAPACGPTKVQAALRRWAPS